MNWKQKEELSAFFDLCVFFFPIWSIPVFFVLHLVFRQLKGSVLLAALSFPGLIWFSAVVLPGKRNIFEPGFWMSVSWALGRSPQTVVGAIMAVLCAVQLVLVAMRRLKDPSWFSLLTVVTSIAILFVYFLIYHPLPIQF
jgi:hypothetical protein